MAKLYESHTYFANDTVGYTNYESQEQGLRISFRSLFSKIRKAGLINNSLLEIGCGYGYLLDEAKKYFTQIEGTEMCPEIREKALKYCDQIYVGDVEVIPKDSKYDCIIVCQVIEHIYDPIEFTRKIYSYLNKNGCLVVITPNFNSPIRLLMGKSWPSYKIPEHVSYFNTRSLSTLLKKAGFCSISKLNHSYSFPLSLIFSKFGLKVPDWFGRLCVWIPTTTICMIGKKTD